jgi:ABC-2 type transport system ATP-binding protein
MADPVIETQGLHKSFKGHEALSGLNLNVPAGSIFGFLGRNGAGKTTTIKLLMGFLKADGGNARVLGLSAADAAASVEIRGRVGFVSEEKDLYPFMTVQQIIRFTRSFFPKWRDDLGQRYLRLFDLPESRKVSDLSKGMRSKLMLLLAISHGAELLILDEPSEGLDPVGVEDMLRELVALAAAEGATIFFSSHHLEEVEQIADHVCIIDRGAAIAAGSLDDLKAQYQRLRIVLSEELRSPVDWVDGAEHVRQEGRTVEILARHNVDAIVSQARSLPGATVERFPVTLKEIFLEHARRN